LTSFPCIPASFLIVTGARGLAYPPPAVLISSRSGVFQHLCLA